MRKQILLTFGFGWALAVVFAWGSAAATAAQQQTAPPAAPAQQQNVPQGNAANGRKLFVSFGCYQCHGYEAQGSTATGPRLAPRPIAYAQFMKYVRHPTNEMPPFTEKIVKDAELTDIYAFLRAQPPAPDVDKIPLLKQ
jgi:cytochrome c2